MHIRLQYIQSCGIQLYFMRKPYLCRMKFEEEFKQAIRELPEKEKDKLLLRLLKKDRILALRLEFELLGLESADDKRLALEELIRTRLRSGTAFGNIQKLIAEIRSLSAKITEHVKITKDKTGEVTLNLLLLNETLLRHTAVIERARWEKAQKAATYIATKAAKLLLLISALHEDYRSDYKEDLERLGALIGKSDLLERALSRNGVEVKWLQEGEWPEDEERQKRLRKRAG